MKINIMIVLLVMAVVTAWSADARLGRLGQFENGTALINDALERLDTQLTDELGIPLITYTVTNNVTATNILTVAANPTTNDTMTIGDYIYTFVTNVVDDGDILIGAAVTNTQASIITAVAADGVVTMASFSTNNTSILTSVAIGVATNIVCTETFTSVSNLFSNATMVGGVDGTTSDSSALRDADYLYIKLSTATWGKISITDL